MLSQVKRSCLMGARRMMMRFNYRYNNNKYTYFIHTIAATPTTMSASHLKDSSCTFNFFISQPRGFGYKCTANHPRFMYYHSQESKTGGECDSEKQKILQQCDVVNISQLLFTKDRDYLIRYNDPQPVTAEQLAGKLIVIYFVPLYLDSDLYPPDRLFKESLIDTYNDLKFKNCFEVVMVADDDASFSGELEQLCPDPSLQRKFEDIFSKCPSWTAIPFSDITSRKRLKSSFGHFGRFPSPVMVLIDSKGRVLDTSAQNLFKTYGSDAYPFTYDRLAFLKSKDKTAFCQYSLKELLGSSERDFVISNKGEEVPIHTLEDKVVALYFYEDGFSPDFLTRKLKMHYEELKKKNQNFEVVLLYLYDTNETIYSTKEKFQKTFETMPWLALPYKDPVHKKLKRIFGYPDERFYYTDGPSLVIVGSHRSIIGCRDIIESGAATISRGYNDLITREEFAKVEGKSVGELKLEMLCSPNTVFKRKDGSEVILYTKRIFGYPDERFYYTDGPSLVIVGSHRSIIGCRDIIESGAATISRGYNDLITREEFAKVEGKSVGELKLEMLCSPNTVFKRKDGSEVQFSQLIGKRIIILFEGDYPEYDGVCFRENLVGEYMRKKGTANEFEVIYFPNNKDKDGKRVADMPWFVSCAVEMLPGCSSFLSFYGNSHNRYHSSLLLAFGRDGRLVRRTICPWFGDFQFPFYANGVDTEAFDIEHSDFCWGYWDTLYQGLLRDSKSQIKFPSSNHLFCVYYY